MSLWVTATYFLQNPRITFLLIWLPRAIEEELRHLEAIVQNLTILVEKYIKYEYLTLKVFHKGLWCLITSLISKESTLLVELR